MIAAVVAGLEYWVGIVELEVRPVTATGPDFVVVVARLPVPVAAEQLIELAAVGSESVAGSVGFADLGYYRLDLEREHLTAAAWPSVA